MKYKIGEKVAFVAGFTSLEKYIMAMQLGVPNVNVPFEGQIVTIRGGFLCPHCEVEAYVVEEAQNGTIQRPGCGGVMREPHFPVEYFRPLTKREQHVADLMRIGDPANWRGIIRDETKRREKDKAGT